MNAKKLVCQTVSRVRFEYVSIVSENVSVPIIRGRTNLTFEPTQPNFYLPNTKFCHVCHRSNPWDTPFPTRPVTPHPTIAYTTASDFRCGTYHETRHTPLLRNNWLFSWRTLRRPRRWWEDHIKLQIKDIGWEWLDWIHVALVAGVYEHGNGPS
jgi:hypothetical protein